MCALCNVCMYVCMYEYLYEYAKKCMYVSFNVCKYRCMYVYTVIYIYVYSILCIGLYPMACIFVCMYVCMFEAILFLKSNLNQQVWLEWRTSRRTSTWPIYSTCYVLETKVRTCHSVRSRATPWMVTSTYTAWVHSTRMWTSWPCYHNHNPMLEMEMTKVNMKLL